MWLIVRKAGFVALVTLTIAALAIWGLQFIPNYFVRTTGPFTVDDAAKKSLGMSLYGVGKDRPEYQQISTVYFTIDTGDEIIVQTYFLLNQGSQTQIVAKMVTSTLLTGGPDELLEKVALDRAVEGSGYTCKAPKNVSNLLGLENPTYISCLFWMSKDKLNFQLYTIWPAKDTVKFANSLFEVKARSQ